MTRTHAAYQLLRHGPLNSDEFREITGWSYNACEAALRALRKRGLVRLARRGGDTKFRSIYEVKS